MHSVLIFLSRYHLHFNLSVGRITHNIWFPTLSVVSPVEQFVSPGGRKKILKLWAVNFSFSSKEFWCVSIVLYYELYSTWFFINEVSLVQQVDAPTESAHHHWSWIPEITPVEELKAYSSLVMEGPVQDWAESLLWAPSGHTTWVTMWQAINQESHLHQMLKSGLLCTHESMIPSPALRKKGRQKGGEWKGGKGKGGKIMKEKEKRVG